jgi:RNA polymerase sigma-70 factor (ECF subfamily)
LHVEGIDGALRLQVLEPYVLAIDPPKGTDLELLSRLQRGDNDAWAKVTREYSPRLYAYLRQSLPTSEDAEDVLSETLSAAVRAVVNFDGRAALSTYLYSIAHRKVADYWRRTPKSPTVDADNPTLTLIAPGMDLQDRVVFTEALNSHPQISRDVLLMRYHVGLGVDEIAQTLDRSYKGTESLLSRARTQLRDAMRGSEGHGIHAF